MCREHVAIIVPEVAEGIRKGVKTVESRFSRTRRAPLGHVQAGDRIHFKITGGDIIGSCDVLRVEEYDALTPTLVQKLERSYRKSVAASAEYWRSRRDCRYGTLIWLDQLVPSELSIQVPRQYGTAWLMLKPA